MKKIAILGLSSLFIISGLFSSCDAIKNTNNTQRGAGIGAATGALLGGIL